MLAGLLTPRCARCVSRAAGGQAGPGAAGGQAGPGRVALEALRATWQPFGFAGGLHNLLSCAEAKHMQYFGSAVGHFLHPKMYKAPPSHTKNLKLKMHQALHPLLFSLYSLLAPGSCAVLRVGPGQRHRCSKHRPFFAWEPLSHTDSDQSRPLVPIWLT